MKSRFKLVSFLLCLVNLAEIKKLCYPKNNNPTLKLKESTVQPGFGLTHFSFESPLWLPQLKMIHSFPSNAKIPAMFQCIKRQIKKGSESGGQKMLLFPLSFTDLQDNEQSDSKIEGLYQDSKSKIWTSFDWEVVMAVALTPASNRSCLFLQALPLSLFWCHITDNVWSSYCFSFSCQSNNCFKTSILMCTRTCKTLLQQTC